MSIARLKKVQLLAHSGAHQELLFSLQEEGLIHIERTDVEESGMDAAETEVSDLDHWIYKLDQAIDFLAPWQERTLGEKLSGQKPEVQIRERIQALNYAYQPVLEQIEGLESEQNELMGRIRFLEKEQELLIPWQELSLPLHEVRDTGGVRVLLGALPTARRPDLASLSDAEPLYWEAVREDKRLIHVLLLLWGKEADRLEPALRELDFNPLHFTDAVLNLADPADRVADVIGKLRGESQAAKEKLEGLTAEAKRLAGELDELKRVYDVLSNERARRQSEALLGRTRSVFYLEGWIREADTARLQERLEPYAESVDCYLRDPEPEEDHPIALQNRRVWRPFELITQLYGLPRKGSLDPTVFLAPFFFVFVGLTVSEAGYGALVAVLCLLFMKLAKPKGGLRMFLILMAILGVSNVILGTLVGGWFGFPIKKLLLLDPLQDPVRFLLLALVLGFIQVWFGTFLNLISLAKQKEYSPAVVQAGWLLLLPGLVLYGIGKQPVWGYLALAGAAAVVVFTSSSRNPLARFFGGLYGLYGISGYLSDILSYSRLLALGLATTVIAMVVNTLCQTALGIPWVGWLLAALIFVGGHLFNLGISFLGGFVHSMRLQFVEFFSKFFQSGGKPFKPFVLESRYIDFT
jgi:V/A-type H+-transporting ATPase subunit I